MARLAWFTPTAPSRSGIASYNEELLPRLAHNYDVDVFTSPLDPGVPRPAGYPAVFASHEFSWRNFTRAYDLVVYQLGNATCHDFMWPYLFRHPGLVVLHDGQLHHSRARALLARGRADDYRAEFRANHPGAPADAPELVIHDLAGATYYFWPMLKLVVERARLVAVHSARLAAALAADFGAETATIRMGVADPLPSALAGRAEIRARHGFPPDAVVFAAFGMVTPEKGVSEVLRVLPVVARTAPGARLLLVGGTADHLDALAEARRAGVADRVTVTGYVPDDELAGYLGAADACLCLRWPSGRETSASWIRALAAGRPTVVTDLSHSDEAACYDPRTWTIGRAGSGDAAGDVESRAVSVGIDVLDERHSLMLAMTRLAADAALRDRLGRAARTHWERRHTLACMVEDYGRALSQALRRSAPTGPGLPPHLEADGTELARKVTSDFGVSVDVLGPHLA